jgi:poly-gamma-glutamate capsule biosynthesis protein CapA/YwtB (metallophosphatase superfamily)
MKKVSVLQLFFALFIITLLLFLYEGFFVKKNFSVNLDEELEEIAAITKAAAKPTPTPTPAQFSIIFAGDAMFDRNIRIKVEAYAKENQILPADTPGAYDFIFEDLKDLFNKQDLVLVNLEGPITTFKSKSVGTIPGSTNNYFFTFDPVVINTLKNNKINLVSLGNNHILNFAQVGLDQTIKFLDEGQIAYFGQVGSDKVPAFYIYEEKGLKIAFVNYNYALSPSFESSLEDVRQLKEKVEAGELDLIFVYTHWGIEYQTIANQTIVNQAHQLIDNGADLIIGSHPHVVQNNEVYKNKMIYYSLGNFIFDQYFEENVKKGLLIEVKINAETKEMEFKEYPVDIDNSGQTKLAS